MKFTRGYQFLIGSTTIFTRNTNIQMQFPWKVSDIKGNRAIFLYVITIFAIFKQSSHIHLHEWQLFIIPFFRSARTSCTTFGWSVCPSCPIRAKNLDHLYPGIYAFLIMKSLIKHHPYGPMGIPWMPS